MTTSLYGAAPMLEQLLLQAIEDCVGDRGPAETAAAALWAANIPLTWCHSDVSTGLRVEAMVEAMEGPVLRVRGSLMATNGWGADEAMTSLRDLAQRQRTTVVRAATVVLDEMILQPDGHGPCPLPGSGVRKR